MESPRYLYYNLNLLRAITVLSISTKSSTKKYLYNLWYCSWRVLCFLAILYIMICSSIDLYLRWNVDIMERSATIVNLSMYGAMIVRIVYFTSVEKKTENLIKSMFETFRYSSESGLPREIDMKKYVFISNVAYLLWFGTALSGAELYIIIQIFTSKERSLPMQTWHPYDALKTPYFELTCCAQIFAQAVMVLLMNGTDTFWTFIAYVTSGQFKLLAYEFENVCFTTLIKFGVDPEAVLDFKNSLPLSSSSLDSLRIALGNGFRDGFEIFESDRYNKIFKEEFVKVIDRQKKLMDFCELMDDYWSNILLPMVLITQTYTTFSCFVMLLSPNFLGMLRISQYIIPMLLEIGFLTFSGQLLLNESERIQVSLYSNPWYLMNEKSKKILQIAHFRAKNPFYITMAKFAPVDLKAYTYLMKSSGSYLAVLNKMRTRY